MAAMCGECFGEAVGPPDELLIYRALVVQYEFAAGLTHQVCSAGGKSPVLACARPLGCPQLQRL